MNLNQVSARLGLDEGVEDFMSSFHFPIRYQSTVFHAALKNGADLYIADTHENN
ncbi:hypothetical protein [Candidatus Vondammii sp. HM_W22]|uniref:hypothetical protein n=1 Tax=Candidatus Vondammii sp. HM_W22 TaxID=2687299 RepID=UPI001F140D54|nr:hypothetical protein [Candidatus Vondammii sp. HM_W22]